MIRLKILEDVRTPEQTPCHLHQRLESNLDLGKPGESEIAMEQADATSCLLGLACLHCECKNAVECAAGQVLAVEEVGLQNWTVHHDSEHFLVERRLGHITVRQHIQHLGGKQLESPI